MWQKFIDAPATLPTPSPITEEQARRRCVFIDGPAGCGKSYAWLQYIKQNNACILSPTVELMTEHRSTVGKASQTAAKVFQFSMSDSVYFSRFHPSRPIYVIDEFTMTSSAELTTMLRRAPHSMFILLGDTRQICRAIDSEPITSHPAFTTPMRFIPTGPRRQQGEFCEWLDRVRDMDPTEAITAAIDRFGIVPLCPVSQVFGGSWAELAPFNKFHKEHAPVVKLRSKKEKRIIDVPRAELTTEQKSALVLTKSRNQPAPFEVVYGCTVDAVQGRTITDRIGLIVRGMTRPGVLYTALSRVRDPSQIRLFG